MHIKQQQKIISEFQKGWQFLLQTEMTIHYNSPPSKCKASYMKLIVQVMSEKL